MFALIAVLALVFVIPRFAGSIAELFTNSKFSGDKKHLWIPEKSTFITAVIIVVLTGLHFYGYWVYLKYRDEDLSNKGVYTPGVVIDKKLESKGNNIQGYYIYYTYRYNGHVYKHNCPNDSFEVGDTIVVKFAPGNPNHHLLINKKF